MTISRFDLIAAGADFTLFENRREACLYDDAKRKGCWHVIFYPEHRIAKIGVLTESGQYSEKSSFQSGKCFGETRQQVADYVEHLDPRDAAPLRLPWASHANTGWPGAKWAVENGLTLDALLYSAVQNSASIAAKMYLDAGADPLVYTYEGDCAARLGVARNMLSVFDRPEWLNAQTKVSRETGLHWLAHHQSIHLLERAVRMGADPDLCDRQGKSALDLVNAAVDHTELHRLVSEMRAKRLRFSTVEANAEVKQRSLARRRL